MEYEVTIHEVCMGQAVSGPELPLGKDRMNACLAWGLQLGWTQACAFYFGDALPAIMMLYGP